MLRLEDCEPNAGPWSAVDLQAFAVALLAFPRSRSHHAVSFVAVDGRSASGKTTLSRRLAAVIPNSVVIHTDDIAWWHSRFGWTDLLINGLITPALAGEPVSFTPPAWSERGREGAISIPEGTEGVIVEGVGSARREHADSMTASVWVQADLRDGEAREAQRMLDGETTQDDSNGWMAEELPFLAGDRPWDRADFILCSSLTDLEGQVWLSERTPLPAGLA